MDKRNTALHLQECKKASGLKIGLLLGSALLVGITGPELLEFFANQLRWILIAGLICH